MGRTRVDSRRSGEPHIVYFLLDKGTIVYIGHTFELEQRLKWVRLQHPDWVWDETATSEEFPNRAKATEFERRAIAEHQPKYNTQSSDRDGHAATSPFQYRKFGEKG